MKKILIALAIMLAVQVADAQVKTPEAAKKALDGAVATSQDAKKATKVGTWLKLATAYMDAYNAPAGSVWLGASKQELQLLMGNQKPRSVEQVSLGGEPCTKEVYKDKEFYFNQNGQLVMINVTKPVVSLIVGRNAPTGKSLGHAGAIVSGNVGTAATKIAALQDAGVHVVKNPVEMVEQIRRLLGE